MKTVVIADDEPITRLNLNSMLTGAGYKVIGEAKDGFDAIELCRKSRPDMLLLDIKMGVFDGLSAAETICSDDLAGCVIMITAFADEEFVVRANQIGVSGYLVKPINQKQLLPALEIALAQSDKLRRIKQIVREKEETLYEKKIIDYAKVILSRRNNISEADAYRLLQKMAMDKRSSIVAISKTIIEQDPERKIINEAKRILMKKFSISEKAAYKRIIMLAQKHNSSIIRIAQQIIVSEDK